MNYKILTSNIIVDYLLVIDSIKEYAKRVKDKVSNQKLLQQAGNAMTTSVIEEIAKNLIEAIGEQKMTEKEILVNRGSTTANMLQFKINPAELIGGYKPCK